MLKSIVALQLLLLCATLGSAQESAPDPTVKSTPEQKRFDVLLERVSSLPPEYKADLGFTILDGTSLSPAQKKSLLDDIFQSAARSHYPYGVTNASSQMHNDLVARMLGNSKLDVLEIEARSVEHALPCRPSSSPGTSTNSALLSAARRICAAGLILIGDSVLGSLIVRCREA